MTDKPEPMIDPPPKANRFAPSTATGGSGVGSALGILYIIWAHQHGTDYPAGAEAAIAVVISTVLTYAAEILAKFGITPP
jgi:hypothetical protein